MCIRDRRQGPWLQCRPQHDVHRLWTAGTLRELVEVLIELGAGLLIDPSLLDVLGDADDGEPGDLIAAARTKPLADRVLASPERIHQSLVHNGDASARCGIGAFE